MAQPLFPRQLGRGGELEAVAARVPVLRRSSPWRRAERPGAQPEWDTPKRVIRYLVDGPLWHDLWLLGLLRGGGAGCPCIVRDEAWAAGEQGGRVQDSGPGVHGGIGGRQRALEENEGSAHPGLPPGTAEEITRAVVEVSAVCVVFVIHFGSGEVSAVCTVFVICFAS